MAFENQNFRQRLGDFFIMEFTVENITDASAYSWLWTMKVDANSPVIFQKEDIDSDVTIDGNKVLVSMSSAETKTGLDPGVYEHELQFFDSQGLPGTASAGTVTFLKPLQART
jgi:hypothetical protein